jgi:aliphatic nitrilase
MKKRLLPHGGGFARIYGPQDSDLAAPRGQTGKGLLFADLDFSLLAIATSTADPLGHCWPPEVFGLQVNLAPTPKIVHRGAEPQSTTPKFEDAEFVSVTSGAR